MKWHVQVHVWKMDYYCVACIICFPFFSLHLFVVSVFFSFFSLFCYTLHFSCLNQFSTPLKALHMLFKVGHNYFAVYIYILKAMHRVKWSMSMLEIAISIGDIDWKKCIRHVVTIAAVFFVVVVKSSICCWLLLFFIHYTNAILRLN